MRLGQLGVWLVIGCGGDAPGDGAELDVVDTSRVEVEVIADTTEPEVEVIADTTEPEVEVVADATEPDVEVVVDTIEPDVAVADTDEPETVASGPTRYEAGLHSPLTPAVAHNLALIAARAPDARDDVFMKVGDSITAARPFMTCFANPAVDLSPAPELADAVAIFAAADVGATSSFDRRSLSAVSGRTAAWAITPADGEPAPVTQEREAIDPRFAAVMFGTNDIGYWPEDFPRMFRWYGEHMLALLDELTGAGVIPILSSVPPRLDSPDVLDPRVATMNALIWAIAEAYQVPFVDFHHALAATDDWGLAPDGVHPRASCDPGGERCGCRFDAVGLAAGYNVRNRVTLAALDRAYAVVVAGQAPPDLPPRTPLAGSGTAADPFVIDHLPFTDRRDTRAATDSLIDRYDGCAAAQDESGPEVYYRLDLAAPTLLGALVVDRAGVDVDLHLMGSNDPADCRARDDTLIETSAAGTTWLVLDTWVSGGTPRAGEYVLVVHAR